MFEVSHSDSTEMDSVKHLGSLIYDESIRNYIPIMITLISYNDKNGNKIYSVETIDIEAKKSAGQLESSSQNNDQSPIADFTTKIEKEIEKANNSSKVVDENGEPLVVYHGTRADFNIFDINKAGQSNTISKVGFWFSTEKGFGEKFAEEIWYGGEEVKELGVFLNIKKPKIFYGGKSENHLEIENEIKETSQAIKRIERKYHSDNANFEDIYPKWRICHKLYKSLLQCLIVQKLLGEIVCKLEEVVVASLVGSLFHNNSFLLV